jgi:hypothetical protein
MKTAEEFYLDQINPDSQEFKNNPIHQRIIGLMEAYRSYKQLIHDKETTYLVAKCQAKDIKIKELSKDLREINKMLDDPQAIGEYLAGI